MVERTGSPWFTDRFLQQDDREHELTKNQGLSSSFHIGDVLNALDSFQWESRKRGAQVLECLGRSKKFPLTQRWTFAIDASTIHVTYALL